MGREGKEKEGSVRMRITGRREVRRMARGRGRIRGGSRRVFSLGLRGCRPERLPIQDQNFVIIIYFIQLSTVIMVIITFTIVSIIIAIIILFIIIIFIAIISAIMLAIMIISITMFLS